jgi:fucose 4-O-acetylase-like acetyltransferase
MKKTYLWRTAVLFIGLLGITIGYVAFYPYSVGLCVPSVEDCFFSGLKKTFAEPLFLYSLFLFATSPFLFFINDKVFLKWLRFVGVWVVLSVIIIAVTPATSHGWISLGPDREMVSIWMGALFVVLSLGKIVWDVRKEKNRV